MPENDEKPDEIRSSTQENDDEIVFHEGLQKINALLHESTVYESPINIHIANVTPLKLPNLEWHHMNLPPKKVKISNTGHTVILSAKWLQERPYLSGGPFIGNYVFSQLHFHWGANNMEGSEHTISGVRCILEMHVVFFKSCYLTQESALKRKDGLAVAVYMFNIQDEPNEAVQVLVDTMQSIQAPNTSIRIQSYPLETFLKVFNDDFFLYVGSVNTATCVHYVMWLICRRPLGISINQMESFRMLIDQNNEMLTRNFREVQPLQGRPVFHVNPSGQLHSTLLVMDKASTAKDGKMPQGFSKYPRSSKEYQNPTGTTIYRVEVPKMPCRVFRNLYEEYRESTSKLATTIKKITNAANDGDEERQRKR